MNVQQGRNRRRDQETPPIHSHHRWPANGKLSFHTKLFTAKADGSDLFVSSIQNPSHFTWLDNRQILVWASTKQHGDAHYWVEDRTDRKAPLDKKTLTRDGHCSLAAQGRWLLTDEYLDCSRQMYIMDVGGLVACGSAAGTPSR